MSNGAKVIDNRVLRNGLGDKVRQTVIQYADGSQVVVSTVLPGGRVGPETLVFLGEGGDISDFSEIAGGRGAGRHDIEVELALKAETAEKVGTEEPDENLFDFAFEGLQMQAGALLTGDPGHFFGEEDEDDSDDEEASA